MSVDLQARFEAAGRTPPADTLDLAAVMGTGRRRRRRRREAWAGAGLACVMVVGAGAAAVDQARGHENRSAVTAGPDHRPVTVEHTAPGPVVREVATALDDGSITWPVEWVATTEFGAADLTGAGPGVNQGPIYVVEIHGRFTGLAGHQVDGPSHGSVLTLWLPVEDRAKIGSGESLNDTSIDLSAYGTVHYYTPEGVSG